MNGYRIAAILLAVFCVTVAVGIAVRKWIAPWLIAKDDAKAQKIRDAEREATEFRRRQKFANGRSQRTGPPLNRKIGGRDAS